MAVKLATAAGGMALALNYSNLGVGAHSSSRTLNGGARNSADRVSHQLGVTQVSNLIAAAQYADVAGFALNRMITIHWEAAGVPLTEMAKATGHFVDLMTKALARRGRKTAWLWVHEGGEGKGGHCHMLAHIPADLVQLVTRLQKRWLRRITGKAYLSGVIHSKPIGRWLGIEENNHDLYAINLDATLAYVLKGAGREAAIRFGLERLEPGGCIIGKRCGTSQNIGAKARRVNEKILAANH